MTNRGIFAMVKAGLVVRQAETEAAGEAVCPKNCNFLAAFPSAETIDRHYKVVKEIQI